MQIEQIIKEERLANEEYPFEFVNGVKIGEGNKELATLDP